MTDNNYRYITKGYSNKSLSIIFKKFNKNNFKKIMFINKNINKTKKKLLWSKKYENDLILIRLNSDKIKTINGMFYAYKDIVQNQNYYFKDKRNKIYLFSVNNFQKKEINNIEYLDLCVIKNMIYILSLRKNEYIGKYNYEEISKDNKEKEVNNEMKNIIGMEISPKEADKKIENNEEIKESDILGYKFKDNELDKEEIDENEIIPKKYIKKELLQNTSDDVCQSVKNKIENIEGDVKSEYYIEIELSDSTLIKRAKNVNSLNDTEKIYNYYKENYELKSIKLINIYNGVAKIIRNDISIKRKYNIDGYMQLIDEFINLYQEINKTNKNINCELKVKSKIVNNSSHYIESISFVDDYTTMQEAIDYKIKCDQRRLVKEAKLIKDALSNGTEQLNKVMQLYTKLYKEAKIDLYMYKEGRKLYAKHKKEIEVFKYNDTKERDEIIKTLKVKQGDTEILDNSELKKVYFYRHCLNK